MAVHVGVHPPALVEPLSTGWTRPPIDRGQASSVVVRVAVHQPAPDRTLAVSLDSTPDLSSTNSPQAHCVDAEHQATDLAVGVRPRGVDAGRLRARTAPTASAWAAT